MASLWQQPALTVSPRSRIRAVIGDSDKKRRNQIVSAVIESQLFEVIAEVCTPYEYHSVLRDDVPELAISPATFVPGSAADSDLFPLFIAVGATALDSPRLIACLPDSMEKGSLQEAVSSAASRILTLKAGELSALIHKYLVHSTDLPRRARTVVVEQDGRTIELDTEQILWIEADGNYVTLHAGSEMLYELREPIKTVHARLAPEFIRVHRGALVNSTAIQAQIIENGVPACLVLADGTRVPVGPNYRSEVPPRTAVFT